MLIYLEKKTPIFWSITGLIFVVIVGTVDYLTGREIAFSLFYLIPIVMVTWFAGRNQGILISIASAITWYIADDLSGQTYSRPFIGYWNASIRLGFFIIVSMLLPALKALEREKRLSRIDDLTGAYNRRSFFELAQREIDRAQRYERPFTLAYIDLDNFKTINDKFGHVVGDNVLRILVEQALKHLRKTDIIARLGGDEFILFFPETNRDMAQVVISKIQVSLVNAMRKNDWPITLSIGALVCLNANITIDELVKRADALMYSVKEQGKNAIAYEIYGSQNHRK